MTTSLTSQVPRDWYWIRHAAPFQPQPRALCGHSDWQVAVDPALIIQSYLPDKADWQASDLGRCRQTVAALQAGGRPLQVIYNKVWREQNFGQWEGRTYESLDVDDYQRLIDQAPPGGEGFADLCRRVARAINVTDQQTPADRPIIVVAHAGVIRAALCLALDVAPAAALRFNIDYLSSTKLCRMPDLGSWSVMAVNKSLVKSESGQDKIVPEDNHTRDNVA